MAISYSCDGCGEKVETPEVVGHVVKREYCADCAVRAKNFVEAEEALRKATYEKFTTDRELLISQCSEGGFQLPDVA